VITNIFEQLARDEAMRLFPYKDTVGKLTIGCGRNLSDVGISIEEARYLLQNDVQNAVKRLEAQFPWAAALDEARHGALVNMAFNLGIAGLAGFKNFLAAMQKGDWKTAQSEMLNSYWAREVGARAVRLAVQIETGEWQ